MSFLQNKSDVIRAPDAKQELAPAPEWSHPLKARLHRGEMPGAERSDGPPVLQSNRLRALLRPDNLTTPSNQPGFHESITIGRRLLQELGLQQYHSTGVR